jgi:hypothetical protein
LAWNQFKRIITNMIVKTILNPIIARHEEQISVYGSQKLKCENATIEQRVKMMTSRPKLLLLVFFHGFFLLTIHALSPFELPQVWSSRRSLVIGTVSAAAAGIVLTKTPPIGQTSDGGTNTKTHGGTSLLSFLDDVVQWIDTYGDKKFIHAVVASDYRFMYRGEDSFQPGRISQRVIGTILAPPPDLLIPGTYGTSSAALDYFRMLEDIMVNEPVRPSIGHLATTSAHDASAWGPAVSVWPAAVTGNSLAWFQDGGLFYPRPHSSEQDRNAVQASLVVNGRNCGEVSLDDILSQPNSEIMFSAPSFLAVPARFDAGLRSHLRASFII